MVKISGTASLNRRLTNIPKRAEQNVGKALYVGAQNIGSTAKKSITSGSRSGAGHIPSRPGEPPNADTRQLDTSIVARKTGRVKAQVVSQAPYSAALEHGTRNMAARPFMGPAVDTERPNLRKLLLRAIKRAVR